MVLKCFDHLQNGWPLPQNQGVQKNNLKLIWDKTGGSHSPVITVDDLHFQLSVTVAWMCLGSSFVSCELDQSG